MHEIIGDFWGEATKGYDAIVCTTNNTIKNNNELVMGAGIAKQFAERYPNLPKRLGRKTKINPDYNLHLEIYNNTRIFALRTKHNWRDKSDIKLIIVGLAKLHHIATLYEWRILMTRPGCGNGGLNWLDIKQIFDENKYDYFYVINPS